MHQICLKLNKYVEDVTKRLREYPSNLFAYVMFWLVKTQKSEIRNQNKNKKYCWKNRKFRNSNLGKTVFSSKLISDPIWLFLSVSAFLDWDWRTTSWTMANPNLPRQDFLSSVEKLQNLVQNMNIEAKPATSNVPSDPQEPQSGLLR